MTRARVRAILSHRRWTYAALFSAAIGALAWLFVDLLVALRVDCRIYHGPVSGGAQWIGVAAFYAAIPLVVLNGIRAWLMRSRSLIFLSIGLVAAGIGLFWFTFDYTFTYCWLTGLDLPPCLLGCAH